MNDEPIVWMKCPYPDEICAESATWSFNTVSAVDDAVEGEAVCSAGHHWRISKLSDNEVVA